jgi:polyvinyl alcohol dehydrogenase (cytochrome)
MGSRSGKQSFSTDGGRGAAAGSSAAIEVEVGVWVSRRDGGLRAADGGRRAAGRVFLGVDTGYVYSIDAASGCVYWSFQALAGVRSPISLGPIEKPRVKNAAYFGDIRGNVYAVDASTGELLWKVVADAHPIARITGGPKLYHDRLYVPVSSMEEGAGGNPMYQCCTFRGSVVALDANTGGEIWKTYTISEAAKPLRRNSQGVQLWGPAGGGVWDSPTIDLKRNAIYVGTGDAYSGTAPSTTDAILALDMETGKILWAVQDTARDAWIGSCRPPHPSENCPDPLGPDYDFGTSPILKTLPDGHRLLVAGQKSGIVWAHDPDQNGALLWKTNLAPKPPNDQGEVVCGGAADEENAYFGLNSGGVAALQLASGERKWFTPLDPAAGMGQHRGESGPVSAIPGVVFSGGWDGVLRAFSVTDGRLLWDFNTLREFKTVNEVAAKGGSMGATGPTIAGGMVFVGSGYIGVQNGMPGNVLLAFSAE